MIALHSSRRVSQVIQRTVSIVRRLPMLFMISLILLPPFAGIVSARPAVAIQDTAAAPSLDEITTIAYHEINRWETWINAGGPQSPILSDDGQTIAFARAPGSGDPATPNRIFVIGADGTGEREIDA